MIKEIPHQFIVGRVFLTSTGADFHHLLLHVVLHVSVADHRIAKNDNERQISNKISLRV